MSSSPSRRGFIATSGGALGAAWLFGLGPVVDETRAWARSVRGVSRPWDTFTDREGADFEAFSGRVIPSDDTPGAVEAGCVHFADRALGTYLDRVLEPIRGGLALLDAWATEEGAPFADLAPGVQDRLVARLEADPGPAFFLMRSVVVIGFIGDPSYGGNRARIGWRHLGFEDSFVHQPPFGWYDRDEHGRDQG